MVKIDPQQEIFTALLLKLQEKYDTYDSVLPPAGTPYPFVYLGESNLIDEANKTAVFGTVTQSIHVWHSNPRERGTVSKMLLDIKTVCRNLKATPHFYVHVSEISQQILPDSTVKPPLIHGVLLVDFKFN